MQEALLCRGLGKAYARSSGAWYGTARDALAAGWDKLRSGKRTGASEPFWALRGVDLKVQPGEVIGLIGRNGAGKSTLLKLLSGVTAPTEGSIALRGRVGALLEVGSGFHPELTGRENIRLNGAILGFRRHETARRFDDIVEFAGIREFLDVPVKRYSSGMFVRLAFSVAAHLEPDVLLLDEVLAVGDSAFQRKCLGKMGEVANAGHTVLMVSHNMASIRQHCSRAVWLDGGRVRADGDPAEVVGQYEAAMTTPGGARPAQGNGFHAWGIEGQPDGILRTTGPTTFWFDLRLERPLRNGRVSVVLMANGVVAWSALHDDLDLAAGQSRIRLAVSGLPVRPGVYSWLAAVSEGTRELDLWHAQVPLNVATSPQTHPYDEWSGLVNVASAISVEARR